VLVILAGLTLVVLLAGGGAATWLLGPGIRAVSHPVPRAPGEAPVQIPPLTSGEPINILLLGADDDRKFPPGERLTQTMIVLRIEPDRNRVVVFSIPRDLWVKIPGHSWAKIDFAYRWGGVALARQTVTELFHIPIHFYAYVGLQGLVKVVDTVGGVDLDVLHPVVDEEYPDDLKPDNPYDAVRLYLPAGPQHLDGRRALEYVRSRHGDQLSDIGRSIRQQQLLFALRQRLATIDLVSQLPVLSREFAGVVESDVGPLRAAQLGLLASALKREDIDQLILFLSEFVDEGWSEDGQQILLPRWPRILAEVQRRFGGGA
jgi:LCP family protein required for cell wall assembly